MSGRIAKEIGIIRGLDLAGFDNYLNALAKDVEQYSPRYTDVNRRMAKDLGAKVMYSDSDVAITQYPQLAKMMEGNNVLGMYSEYEGDLGHRVAMIKDTPFKQPVKTHELAHLGLRHDYQDKKPLIIKEIEAEGTAYGVGYKLGVPLDVLERLAAATIGSRSGNLSLEQIGNIIELRKPVISKMVSRFMSGT